MGDKDKESNELLKAKEKSKPPEKENGNGQFSRVNMGEYDKRDLTDNLKDSNPDVATVEVTIIPHGCEENTRGKLNKLGRGCYDQMQLAILVLLFVEKFVEIVAVFLFTLLAVVWEPLNKLVAEMLLPLGIFVIVAMVTLTILYRIRWFRQSPGFIVYKFLYLFFLTAVFLLLAIHAPVAMPFLSSYFALVAAGTIAATYIFFAFIAVTHKHLCKVHARGCSLWIYGVLMPIGILLVNQPIYLYGGVWQTQDYRDFMVNITVGVLVSLVFSYETLFIYQRFVSSNQLKDFINTPGLLPGFVTVCFARKQYNDNTAADEEQ